MLYNQCNRSNLKSNKIENCRKIKMKVNRYSFIFKQLRMQKQLPLSFFEKVGVRKSNISKFERGELMMSFDKIANLLSAMNISLSEYELLINSFRPSFQDQFFTELENAEFMQDQDRLVKLSENVESASPLLMLLVTKSKITPLDNSEVDKILNYLKLAPNWGYFELSLLQAILEVIEIKEAEKIFSSIEERIYIYRNIFKYRRKIVLIALHYILILSSKREKKFAEQILIKINKIKQQEFDFFLSCIQKLVTSFMKYQFENKEEGAEECLTILNYIETLGNRNLRHYYERIMMFKLK